MRKNADCTRGVRWLELELELVPFDDDLDAVAIRSLGQKRRFASARRLLMRREELAGGSVFLVEGH